MSLVGGVVGTSVHREKQRVVVDLMVLEAVGGRVHGWAG
jgi:hypothetical protein